MCACECVHVLACVIESQYLSSFCPAFHSHSWFLIHSLSGLMALSLPLCPSLCLNLTLPPLPPPFVKSILSMFLFMNNFVVGCIHTPYGQCLRYNHTLCTGYVYAGTSLGFSFIFWICTHFSLWMSLLGSCTCVNVVDFRSAPVYSNARGLRSMTSNFQTLPLCLSTPRLLKLVKKKKRGRKKDLEQLSPANSTTQQSRL